MKNSLAAFQNYKIRRIYDEDKEVWYFSIIDIIHEEWTDVSIKEHKVLKALKTQNLRGHMSELAYSNFWFINKMGLKIKSDKKLEHWFDSKKWVKLT
jgi:hypothetical protein